LESNLSGFLLPSRDRQLQTNVSIGTTARRELFAVSVEHVGVAFMVAVT
jgi:hypothetical protein